MKVDLYKPDFGFDKFLRVILVILINHLMSNLKTNLFFDSDNAFIFGLTKTITLFRVQEVQC